MRSLAPALLSLGLALAPLAPLAAQEASIAEPSQATPLQQRTAQVVELLNGTLAPEEAMAASFLQSVSAEQIKAIGAQLTSQFGPALAVEKIEPVSPARAPCGW